MALWDLAGKRAEVPVCALLGGAVRPRAEFGAYSYSFDLGRAGLREADVPAAMARVAADAVTRTGADTFEFKVGRFSEETDIETIRAVRAAIGDRVVLGVDANMACDLDRTRRVLGAVESARLDWFEEPVASLVEMQRLAGEFDVRLSSHCTDLEKLPLYPGIEGIVGDIHFQGGLAGTARDAAALRAQGRRFWQRSSLELGISWAAMVHFGISCLDLGRASQSLIDLVEDDLVLGEPWLVKEGGCIPPERPGLGVELDRSALERYSELYRTQGEFTYFDGE
jgi:glucarate dehydratase